MPIFRTAHQLMLDSAVKSSQTQYQQTHDMMGNMLTGSAVSSVYAQRYSDECAARDCLHPSSSLVLSHMLPSRHFLNAGAYVALRALMTVTSSCQVFVEPYLRVTGSH
jgi:hypothetical protein